MGLDGNALWAMVGSRASAGTGTGPSWEIEGTLKEEKLGPPPILRRLILPILVLLVVLFVWMWLREKRRADRVEQSAAPVEAVGGTGATG